MFRYIYLVFLIFIYSEYFGVLQDDNYFVLQKKNIFAFFCLSSIPFTFLEIKKQKDMKSLKVFVYISLFISFFSSLGILNNGGSLLGALSVARELTVLYTFLFAKMAFNSKSKVLDGVFYLYAIFLTINIISHKVIGFAMPGYGLIDKIDPNSGIHIENPIIILFAACHLFSQKFSVFNPRIINYPLFLWFYFSLALQEHTSIFVGLHFFMIVEFAIERLRDRRIKIPLLIILISFFVPFINFLSSWILGIVRMTNEDVGPIASRIRAANLRIEFFLEKPFFGWGFIGRLSPVGEDIAMSAKSAYDMTLGTVDGGLLDMAVKFGLVGSVAYLICFYACLTSVTSLKAFPMKSILFMLLFISVTWSPLTFQWGLFAILLFSMLSFNYGKTIKKYDA